MARQYQKTNWQNTPSTSTPLSADNLNHIEQGIYDLETKVENNASGISDLQSGKVDKISGKGLSTNDFTTEIKNQIILDHSTIGDLQDGKVDKVTGKGLSTNDFTDAYKSQIATNASNISTNTQDIATNTSLIRTNTQSINSLIDGKVDKVTGKGLSTNDFTNNDVDKLRNDTYTKSETRGLVSKAYHPAGTIHVEDLVSSVLVAANLNNVYNLDGDGTTSNLFIEGAGHPLKDGTNIGVINFGTEQAPNILFDDLGGFVDLSGYVTTSALNTALADKVDKVNGKGLSTNDFTDVYKSQIDTNQGNILTLFNDVANCPTTSQMNTALDGKVDKITGKGLSTNDFTDAYMSQVDTNASNILTLFDDKVDKVIGKGLSTNDFTDNFKKGIAISQELAYDRATIPQPNLDADFHTVNGERTVIYQGNAYSFHTMTYNPISKKYVYGIMCSPVYQGGLFFCEVDNPASDRHNWLDTTTFPTDILINGDIYTAVMPTGEAYYVSYSYNNNDEEELVYCNALDSSRLDYWVKSGIIVSTIFSIGNYVFYVADGNVYKYEFAIGSKEVNLPSIPFAYTYGGGRCIALTKNQSNVISAFMSYDGIEWTKVDFPSATKTNYPSNLIYDHGIFLFYQQVEEYIITSKDGFSWEKHTPSIDMTEYHESYMIFEEIACGGGIFFACAESVDVGHYEDYTIWTSKNGYVWEQTIKYLENEIDTKADYYNGTYLISVTQNLYYPTYRLDGVYGKNDVYTKTESNGLVVANPTDTAEGTLNKLKVNGTTYNLPQGGETNVQADWTETDPTSSAYIQHKPNLGTAASKDVPTSGNATSTQVVMGNDSRLTDARSANDVNPWAKAPTKPTYTASEVGTYTSTEIDNKIDEAVSSCYHPSGSKTVAELVSNLLVSANEGNVYDMSDSGTTTSDFREGAGHPINAGDNVGIVNVGTTQSPVYKFDLLSGFVDLSAYYTKTESDNKYVTKETGKGLSTNDYTTADKNKLANIEAEANKTVVDSAMSDSSTNPLQNKVITKELEGAKTATGNPITVTDAAPVNAVNVSVDLEPIQDLHGYDHPWVGGAGKNLYVNSPYFEGYQREADWTKATEKYNGHDVWYRANTWNGMYYPITISGGITYVFSAMVKVDVAARVYIFGYGSNALAQFDLPANTWTKVSTVFTPESNIEASFRVETGTSNVTIYVSEYQLESGSQATSYADYENICPISGRSEVPIGRDGKNLWDSTDTTNGYIDTDGTITPYQDYETLNYQNVNSGKEYTLSFVRTSRATNIGMRIAWYDANKNFISRDDRSNEGFDPGFKTVTVTAPNNARYARASINTKYAEDISFNESKTYTIQLGDTVYGAHLDATRGVLTVNKGYKLLGDWSWNAVSGYTGVFKHASVDFPTQVDTFLCSHYSIANHSYSVANMPDKTIKGYPNTSENSLFIKDSTYSDATTFTAYLQNNNVQFVYELAEPFTIQLTPQQIKLLENTNTLYTDYEGDTITIEYQPNNAIGEAVRVVEESYNPEFAVRPVLKKKAFSGTTDTDGSVTLISASDIPSGHKIIPLQITDMTINGSAGTYFVDYEPYNSGNAVKGYCYFYMSGSQMFPVGDTITGNFYYYDLEG